MRFFCRIVEDPGWRFNFLKWGAWRIVAISFGVSPLVSFQLCCFSCLPFRWFKPFSFKLNHTITWASEILWRNEALIVLEERREAKAKGGQSEERREFCLRAGRFETESWFCWGQTYSLGIYVNPKVLQTRWVVFTYKCPPDPSWPQRPPSLWADWRGVAVSHQSGLSAWLRFIFHPLPCARCIFEAQRNHDCNCDLPPPRTHTSEENTYFKPFFGKGGWRGGKMPKDQISRVMRAHFKGFSGILSFALEAFQQKECSEL